MVAVKQEGAVAKKTGAAAASSAGANSSGVAIQPAKCKGRGEAERWYMHEYIKKKSTTLSCHGIIAL